VIRLVHRDLVANARIWVGAFVVSVASGIAISVAVSLVTTGIGAGFTRAAALDVLASTVIVLTAVAAAVVLGSVTRLTVSLQSRSYALWQLVGASGTKITWVVRAQLTIVALLGATVGAAAAYPAVPPFLVFGLAGAQGLGDVDPRSTTLGSAIVVLIVTAIVSASGLPASRRAGRVSAVEVLREPGDEQSKMSWKRWCSVILALLLALSMIGSLSSGTGGSQVLLIGPVLTVAAASAGPLLFPSLLRGWTAIVPVRLSPSWFLARNAAGDQVGRSSATISAVLVTVALPGSIYAGSATLGTTAHSDGNSGGALSATTFLLLLGGPLLVSLAGAAATVLMAGRGRSREAALVQAAGGTSAVVLSRAISEAVILVGTAVIVAGAVLIVTAVGSAWSLSLNASASPRFGVAIAGAAAAACLVVLVLASVLPVLAATRWPVPVVLADR